jgi:putative nucleotidyltransferase with HDIG domain
VDGLRLSELIGALSFALDVTEGQPAGHAARSCLIGMRLATELDLTDDERTSLFYGILMKDAGCSSIGSQVAEIYGHDDQAVKSGLRAIDHRKPLAVLRHAIANTEPSGGPVARARRFAHLLRSGASSAAELNTVRCDRGADIARMVGLDEPAVQAIRTVNEHWDGGGVPEGLAGDAIPLLGRLMCLAQTVEVEVTQGGVRHAVEVCRARSGTWFDPALIGALRSVARDRTFWADLEQQDARLALGPLEPGDTVLVADEARLDRIAEAFARVIDAKSPYTAKHSDGVARISVLLAEALGFAPRDVRDLRRAALLHDIGKLGVSSRILDKPGKLDAAEWVEMKRHTELTARILGQVEHLRPLAAVAAAHHERLDGSGYHLGLTGGQLGPAERVLAVADVCEALSADRPYRGPLPPEVVLDIMRKDAGTALCPLTFAALVETPQAFEPVTAVVVEHPATDAAPLAQAA